MTSNSHTLAFDIYGTLFDTGSVVANLRDIAGNKAKEFSLTWRDKQLEYAFRRGLMQDYENFGVCTSNALDYTCAFYEIQPSKEQRSLLLDTYNALPIYSDVEDGLQKLKDKNFRLFAFSNGTERVVNSLLSKSDIRHYFDGIVSVDDVKTFKPDPLAYRHFMHATDAVISNTWLISSNTFDIIGAVSSGMRAAWVQRSKKAIFDPWGIEPTLIVNNLIELDKIIDY